MKEFIKNFPPDLKLACEEADIDLLGWFVHFGVINPHFATCEQCADFKSSVCKGGKKPMECFKGQKFEGMEDLALSQIRKSGIPGRERKS